MKSKRLKIIAVISGLLAILNIAYRFIVYTSIRGSSAIGIIGGADGPTKIFVTKGENGIISFLIGNLIEIFFVICIAVSVIAVVLLLKNKKGK